jgi:L-threonylcarbamoyladenylate synthase
MKAEIGLDLNKAKRILESGNLVGIPTETVYGLAANALDPVAVCKIFEAKNRPKFDPLIVHLAEIEQLESYAKKFPKELLAIAEKFCPGPVTFLVEKKSIIPNIITSGLEKVALRIPNHPLTLALLKSLNFPLAAPSANPFGYVSPTSAHHVFDQLSEKIPYILNGGSSGIGLESTIIGLENEELVIYRKGGLAIEDISTVYSKKISIKDHSSSNPQAPGMLSKHYSPHKRMELWDSTRQIQEIETHKIGFLGFSKKLFGLENQFILSEKEDLNEAAFRLFEGLRYLDKLPIEKIYIELVPEKGLGIAINDRLKRSLAQS